MVADSNGYVAGACCCSSFVVVSIVDAELVLSDATQTRTENLQLSEGGMTAGTRFGLALRAIAADLRKLNDKPVLLAAIFEHGKGRGLVQLVQDAFKSTRAIVVITVDASQDARDVLDGIDEILPPDAGLLLRLGLVKGDEVGTIIDKRWRHHRPEVESPFDPAGVADAFHRPRPIARTVTLLSKMLALQQKYFENHPPWPESRNLFLNAADMRALLGVIDDKVDLEGQA
jgi:hypothetical protein